MQYGYFDDLRREYVITTPHTPLPWINYLGNQNFYGLISNTAGGYTFYQDAKLRRLTRYRYNNVPTDLGGRYYYIKDGETIWNPGFMPTTTELDRYSCRHGLGYTIFESAKNDINVLLTCFIPQNADCEVHKIELTNKSTKQKSINLYGAVEWCLWNAIDDNTNFQRNLNIGEVEIDANTIYHKTEYRERRNHFAFYYMNEPHAGFDTDRDTFLGAYRSFANPLTILEGRSGMSIAAGNAPVAVHRTDITLAPGESITRIFVLGYIENAEDEKFINPNEINKEKAYRMMEMFNTSEKVTRALDEVKLYWQHLLNRFQINTPDEKLNRMVNIWNQYQCMVTFNMSRSASYFESGTGRGMGFRDSCQDLLGFVHLIPTRSRERILDIAAIQFKDGSTYHQYQPLTKRGNGDVGTGFNDDSLWLIAAVASYIKETGDISILNELVPFDNEPGSEKPLFEHLKASINYTIEHLGPHGLPLIGRADWNDCLNLNCFSKTPGESFQTTANFDNGMAESIFIAAMFIYYGHDYIEMAKLYGAHDQAQLVVEKIKQLEQAVIKFGWDGEYYLRAYNAFGHKVGSKECEEGQIYIEPQAFCSLANIGLQFNYPQKALMCGIKYLGTDYGLELLTPAYTRYHLELGEISSYPPGNKENGSIFCHTNPWYVIALARHGFNDAAYDLYKRFSPAYLEDVSEIHETEPYVYSQTIAGRSSVKFGRAKNSWLTGTASWAFVASSQGILGIIPTFNGLKITPALPSDMKKVVVNRFYRGGQYNITIENIGHDKSELIVDGKVINGNIIPLDGEGIHHVYFTY
ncbi:MAG: glycosyl transferase [Bacilli bacterium]